MDALESLQMQSLKILGKPYAKKALAVRGNVPVAEATAKNLWAGGPGAASTHEVAAFHVVLAVAVVGKGFETRVRQELGGGPLPHVPG
jgi:hypothetical protein